MSLIYNSDNWFLKNYVAEINTRSTGKGAELQGLASGSGVALPDE
jgi:hypothetical protein